MALAPVLGSQLTGPRVQVVINGIPIAWASGVSVSDNTQHEEMRTLGSLEVVEFVPVSYGATFSASTFALVTENFATIGVQPSVGQTATQHLLNILAQSPQTAILTDFKTNQLLWTLYGLKYAGASASPSPNSMVMLDVSFYCTRAVPFGAE